MGKITPQTQNSQTWISLIFDEMSDMSMMTASDRVAPYIHASLSLHW